MKNGDRVDCHAVSQTQSTPKGEGYNRWERRHSTTAWEICGRHAESAALVTGMAREGKIYVVVLQMAQGARASKVLCSMVVTWSRDNPASVLSRYGDPCCFGCVVIGCNIVECDWLVECSLNEMYQKGKANNPSIPSSVRNVPR
jgi:hypothetical protein